MMGSWELCARLQQAVQVNHAFLPQEVLTGQQALSCQLLSLEL